MILPQISGNISLVSAAADPIRCRRPGGKAPGGSMGNCKRALSVLLCLCMLAALSACGDSEYRIIDTYSAEGSYVIAFRQGDRLCELVTAAMYELADNGTLRSASYRWFGENLVSVRGEGGEMDSLWESGQWSETRLQELRGSHFRTPYKR